MNKLILLSPVFLFVSCIDMFSDDKKNILEKIYLTHVDGTTIRGYSLSFEFATNLYQPIVEEEIIQLFGDSSTLYIKSYDKGDTNYYRVLHLNGDSIISVEKIESGLFKSIALNSAPTFTWPNN